MTGYFKARSGGHRQELRLLDFSDLDELEEYSDDDNPIDPLDERRRTSFGYSHQCPRCEAITQVIGRDPYCTECNWDSLTDPCSTVRPWAA
jgi:hypothetical protein